MDESMEERYAKLILAESASSSNCTETSTVASMAIGSIITICYIKLDRSSFSACRFIDDRAKGSSSSAAASSSNGKSAAAGKSGQVEWLQPRGVTIC